MTAPTPAPTFQIGRVISRLFGVLARNLASFLALAALLVGLPAAAVYFLETAVINLPLPGSGSPPTVRFAGELSAFLVSPFVTFIAGAVLQGAVIHGTVSDLGGKRASFGDSLGIGLRLILPLVAIGVLSSIGMFFGFLLLIVPGVLLALAWSVAAPAEVMERRGVFGAFSRSAELTRGHRGAILALYLIFFVISFVVQTMVAGVQAVAIGLIGGGLKGLSNFALAQTVATFIAQTLVAMVGAAGIASIYYELRVVKEGVGAEQLAAVFD
jgi:hypothetical protein